MEYFDALLPIGRTNRGCPESPCDEAQALATLDRYAVAEAFVFNTVSRDSMPDEGNAGLAALRSPRLHRLWAFEPAVPAPRKPDQFLEDALRAGVKAVMVNPRMREIRIERSVRILELAERLEARRVPLLAVYRAWDGGQDTIDWYGLADFCNRFPLLPVIAWEFRARSNRPLFDALATAPNLKVCLSSLWVAQTVECICETFGHDRLVFSLGLPELDPRMFQAVVNYAGIDPAARADIAAGTLRKLMKEADYDIQ